MVLAANKRELMSDLLPLGPLSAYLSEILGVTGPLTAAKTAMGQSNPTFVLSGPDGKLVLRRKPAGILLKSAHAIEREYRVMKALEGHLPVPKMYHLCEDPEVIGANFFVMEFIEGNTFVDPTLPSKNATQRSVIYDEMNKGLAVLHSLNPEDLGLKDYGRPGNYFERQVSRWSQQYEASATDDFADMTSLMEWLRFNMPENDGKVSLVHGDWRIDNLLFDRKTNELKAVLDWELSTLGHPMADLGAQLMQWSMPVGDLGRGLEGVDRVAAGIPSDDAYVETYAKRVGLQNVPDMKFYVAFAFFRMAAILQGVKKRALEGNASNPEKAMQLGSYVPIMASRAMTRINAAG